MLFVTIRQTFDDLMTPKGPLDAKYISSFSFDPILFIIHIDHILWYPHTACAFYDDSSNFDDFMTKTKSYVMLLIAQADNCG